MFVAKILLANVLVPIAVSIVSTLIAIFSTRGLGKSTPNDVHVATTEVEQQSPNAGSGDSAESNAGTVCTETTVGSLVDRWIGGVSAALAVWLAFGLQNEFFYYALQDAWLRIPTAVILVAICVILTAPIQGIMRGSVRLIFLLAAAWIVFPTGEAWEFLLPQRAYWIFALAISSLVGWWGVEVGSFRQSGILALAWIPCFAASAFLTSQSFMKVTEPLLAVSSVVGCFGIAALVFRRGKLVAGAAGPCLFASAAAIANAQFNSYLGLSDFLSGLAMFSPALVALSCIGLVSRGNDRQAKSTSTAGMILVPVLTSLLVSAAIIIWTQVASGGGEEEW